jgi:hypothetical protein
LCATAVIAGDLVELRPALCHPALPGPMAFLGNQSLCELLAEFLPLMTDIALLRRWVSGSCTCSVSELNVKDGVR